MMLERSHLARRYAEALAKQMRLPPFLSALRGASASGEHAAIAPHISKHLGAFLTANGHGHDGSELFDWEGSKGREPGTQAHSYDLLGTGTHPDAAILRPFTCAIEIDRETRNASDFKYTLLKASAHVLSGAYDACLFVYLLKQGGTAAKYVSDESNHSARLLDTLRAHGMVVCFVPTNR